MNNVPYEPGYDCLRRTTTEEEDHIAVTEKESVNRFGSYESKGIGIEPFSGISVEVYVVRGIYGICTMCRALFCQRYYLHLNRCYDDVVICRQTIKSVRL